jgi:hypothetical protein
MPDFLVTGIAPTSDPAKLETILQTCNCDRTRLAFVTKANAQSGSNGGHGSGGASLAASATIMTGAGGTGVPGMGSSGASLSSFGHGAAPDFLGGLPMIPSDQAHNFNIAIAEGRCLVTYKAEPDEASTVETAFRQAGLRNVKIFQSTVSR